MRKVLLIALGLVAAITRVVGKTAAYALMWVILIVLLVLVARLTIAWLGAGWLPLTLLGFLVLAFPLLRAMAVFSSDDDQL